MKGKGCCKTIVDILIGMVLGVILFIGAIAGTIYLTLTSFTVGQIQDAVKVEVFKDDNTAGVKDMTLLELAQSLIETFQGLDTLTLNQLKAKYGISIPSEISGLDISGIFDTPIKQIPDNIKLIFDKVKLSDIEGTLSVDLPDMALISDNMDVKVFDAIQNIMDEVDAIDQKTMGELDDLFGLGLYDQEDTNKALMALKNSKLDDFSSALDNLLLSEIIDIDRDTFIQIGANALYERVDRYDEIPEADRATFVGEKFERKEVGGVVTYKFSTKGTYSYTEYAPTADTTLSATKTYYLPTYVNDVTVTLVPAADPVPEHYEYTVRQDGFIALTDLFVDTNTAIGAYTVGDNLSTIALDSEGKLAVPEYVLLRTLVTAATETDPAVYSYAELGGYAVEMTTTDPTDLDGSVEKVDTAPTYLCAHVGTSDMTIQLLADVKVKDAGNMTEEIKSAKLSKLIDIQESDIYREATAAELADTAVAKYVKYGDLYVPYDATDAGHTDDAVVKYVLQSEKSSTVLIALADTTIDSMSDTLKTLTLAQILNIHSEDVYRPATAIDADQTLWFVQIGTEYVKYDGTDAAHVAADKYVIHESKSARVLISLSGSTLETMSDDIKELTLSEAVEIDGDEFARATQQHSLEGRTLYVKNGNLYESVETLMGVVASVVEEGVTYMTFDDGSGVKPCYIRVKNGETHFVLKTMADVKINDLGTEMTRIIDTLKISDIVDINESAKIAQTIGQLTAAGISAGDISAQTLVTPYDVAQDETDGNGAYSYIRAATGKYYRTKSTYVAATAAQIDANADLYVKVVSASNETGTTALTTRYIPFDKNGESEYNYRQAIVIPGHLDQLADFDAAPADGVLFYKVGNDFVEYNGSTLHTTFPSAVAAVAAGNVLYTHTSNADLYENYCAPTDSEMADASVQLYYYDSVAGAYAAYDRVAAEDKGALYVKTIRVFYKLTSTEYEYYGNLEDAANDPDPYREGGEVVHYTKKYAESIFLMVNLDLTAGTPMVQNGATFEKYVDQQGVPVTYLAVYDSVADEYAVYNEDTHGALSGLDWYFIYVEDPAEGKIIRVCAHDATHIPLSKYITVRGYLTPVADNNLGATVQMAAGDEASEKVLVSFKQKGATIKTMNAVIGTLTLGELVVVEPDTILDMPAMQDARLTSIGSDLKDGFSGATLGQMILWAGYDTLDPVVKFVLEDIEVKDFFSAVTASFNNPLDPLATDIITLAFNMEKLNGAMSYTVLTSTYVDHDSDASTPMVLLNRYTIKIVANKNPF